MSIYIKEFKDKEFIESRFLEDSYIGYSDWVEKNKYHRIFGVDDTENSHTFPNIEVLEREYKSRENELPQFVVRLSTSFSFEFVIIESILDLALFINLFHLPRIRFLDNENLIEYY